LQVKSVPTKRAADWWDSSRLTGFFLRFEFFLLSSRIHALPPAANANRWVAEMILCPSLFFSASLRSFPPDERRLSLATHPQDTRRFVTSKLDGRSSAQNARGRRPEVTAAILTDEPLLRDESAFIGRKKKLWGGTPLPHRLFGAGESLH
jgi:hypothetical protein